MGEREPDDPEDCGKGGSPRVSEEVRGEITGLGELIKYSYHVVHTQESIWVHDMRLDIVGQDDNAVIRRILGTIVRRIVENLI